MGPRIDTGPADGDTRPTQPDPTPPRTHRHALSTCWLSHRHERPASMFQEIRRLGFGVAELGHGIRLTMVDGIRNQVAADKIHLSSLHNFCPLPPEVIDASPDCMEFSSPHPPERRRALRFTRQTLDFASELGVDRVVLHLGTTPTKPPGTLELGNLVLQGHFLSKDYARKKVAMVQRRETVAGPILDRVRECLDDLLPYAEKSGVRLGIESRDRFEHVPSEDEILLLLKEYDTPWLGYWHDFGHTQIKENLGFLDHAEWLAHVSDRLLGCHLHDVIWPLADHRAPFRGQIDYTRLMPHVPLDVPIIWEMGRPRGQEQILEARARWDAAFGFSSDGKEPEVPVPQI